MQVVGLRSFFEYNIPGIVMKLITIQRVTWLSGH